MRKLQRALFFHRSVTLPCTPFPPPLEPAAMHDLGNDFDCVRDRWAGAVEEFVSVGESNASILDGAELEPAGQRFENRNLAHTSAQIVAARRNDQERRVRLPHARPRSYLRVFAFFPSQ